MDFNAWLADMTGFLSRYSALFIGGLRNTLILSAIAGVLSILVGGGLCFLRMSRIAPLRWIANIWIEFVRGTPVLVQIMLVYYGLPMIGIEPPVPAFLGSAGNRVMYGIIALTINSGGYICEIIRSGIESVDPGQMEAARSIGFGPVRSMMMIVVPQAVKNILPNFGNEFANLIKASSQVMVIGVAELMFTFNTISSTGRVFTPAYCNCIPVLCDDVYRWTRRTCNGKTLQKSGSVNQFNLLSLYLMIETYSQPFHIQKEDTHMKTTVKRTLSLLLAAASMPLS